MDIMIIQIPYFGQVTKEFPAKTTYQKLEDFKRQLRYLGHEHTHYWKDDAGLVKLESYTPPPNDKERLARLGLAIYKPFIIGDVPYKNPII